MAIDMYTDGGTIGPNPSREGGAWCWCWVENNRMLSHGAGIVWPCDISLSTCSNNFMELFAVVRSLETAQRRKKIIRTIYTDSLVTLYRITDSDAFKGIPDWLEERTRQLRKNRSWNVVLLGGHPSKKELLAGYRKDGKPVSRWNCYCDRECNRLAEEYRNS
jgi:ribonuclease HI